MKCEEYIFKRHLEELNYAKTLRPFQPMLYKSKLMAFLLLRRLGWKDLYKESLRNGTFKSEEEHGRFGFCQI